MTRSASLPKVRLSAGLEFAPALMLAPMEGVTDRSFRRLIVAENPAAVGAACTEFLRVSQTPLSAEQIVREWGQDEALAVPVGVQLMGNDADLIAESALRAAHLGAPFIDLNFGCPAPKVFQHGAGSALLCDRPLLEKIVAATVRASPVPVTAKIRSGIEADDEVEEIARCIEAAGAQLLTVHARLRQDSYRTAPDWSRIRRAVEAVEIPVIGNGSADSPAAIDAMLRTTGCAGVMVGRAAISDPWLFSRWRNQRLGIPAAVTPPSRVHTWLHAYANAMAAGGATERQVLGRLKQSWKALSAGGLLPAASDRTPLTSQSLDCFHQRLGEHLELDAPQIRSD